MSTYKIEIASDQNDLARQANQHIASLIDLALDQRDRCQIALAGGSTPSRTYTHLAQEHLPWDRVDVCLGDERWVDPTDDSSNSLMIRKTLLASGPGANARFHPVPTVEFSSPQESADAFSNIIKQLCVGNPPVFDLIVLGLGDDGHTASLFPGSDAPKVTDRLVVVGKGKGIDRVTLTAPVLSAARKVIFLVSGASKNCALKRLLNSSEKVERTPARLVQTNAEILVLCDKEAAEGI